MKRIFLKLILTLVLLPLSTNSFCAERSKETQSVSDLIKEFESNVSTLSRSEPTTRREKFLEFKETFWDKVPPGTLVTVDLPGYSLPTTEQLKKLAPEELLKQFSVAYFNPDLRSYERRPHVKAKAIALRKIWFVVKKFDNLDALERLLHRKKKPFDTILQHIKEKRRAIQEKAKKRASELKRRKRDREESPKKQESRKLSRKERTLNRAVKRGEQAEDPQKLKEKLEQALNKRRPGIREERTIEAILRDHKETLGDLTDLLRPWYMKGSILGSQSYALIYGTVETYCPLEMKTIREELLKLSQEK